MSNVKKKIENKVGPLENRLASGWCKNTTAEVDERGKEVQWCVMQGFLREYRTKGGETRGSIAAYSKIGKTIADMVPAQHRYRIEHDTNMGFSRLIEYNNHPDTTLKDILQVARNIDTLMKEEYSEQR